MSASRDFRDLGGADPWKLLGVGRDAGAEEIKRSYRRLSRNHHSDLGGNADQQARLNRAYEILSDPSRSAGYALLLHRNSEPPADHRRRPEPDEPVDDPFQWASGPGPTTGAPRSTPPRQDNVPPYRSRYTTPPHQDSHSAPPYQDPYKAPPYREPYTAPRYDDTYYAQPPRRGGVNWQAIAALITAVTCVPVSILLSIAALRTMRSSGERGKTLVWIALAINVAVVAFTVWGRIVVAP